MRECVLEHNVIVDTPLSFCAVNFWGKKSTEKSTVATFGERTWRKVSPLYHSPGKTLAIIVSSKLFRVSGFGFRVSGFGFRVWG